MSASLDTCFAALANPVRRAVIERLTAGPATVSELAAPHDIALPSFLRHLKLLEASGLVRSSKKGRVRTCQIATAPMMEVQGWLEWQRRVWDRGLDPQVPAANPRPPDLAPANPSKHLPNPVPRA